jgi:hypothetical protein
MTSLCRDTAMTSGGSHCRGLEQVRLLAFRPARHFPSISIIASQDALRRPLFRVVSTNVARTVAPSDG